MILRRLGNKKKIAKEIQKYFPLHKIYIEPFFGAGGMFFNKPKAKYNIVNDLDSDVFNLFNVVMNQKEELEKAFYIMPMHSDLLEYWKNNEEVEPIKKALRFLFLSNLINPTNGDIKRNLMDNSRDLVLLNLNKTLKYLNDCNVRFFNEDFNLFINRIVFRGNERPKQDESTFIYCDPPYLGTSDNYSNSFNKEKSLLLFDTLEGTKCKYAMSEFDHPFILEQAKERNLNVIIIGERQNLKNRRVEVLITNYENNQQSLF
tara:strand:+ start:298 stop:1077 length:780 start_codon:yes stop_codon:yes gene_type:complete